MRVESGSDNIGWLEVKRVRVAQVRVWEFE